MQTQIFVRHPGQRQGVVPAREGLQHNTAAKDIHIGTAVLLRRGDAEVTIGTNGFEYILRPPFFVIHTLCKRIQLGFGKAVSLVKDFGFLVGQTSKSLHYAYFVTHGRFISCRFITRQ